MESTENIPAPDSGVVEFISVHLLSRDGSVITESFAGEYLGVQINYRAANTIAFPIFKITITRQDGVICCAVTSQDVINPSQSVQREQQITLQFDRLDLIGGLYEIEVSVEVQTEPHVQIWRKACRQLKILAPHDVSGILCPPHIWSVEDTSNPEKVAH